MHPWQPLTSEIESADGSDGALHIILLCAMLYNTTPLHTLQTPHIHVHKQYPLHTHTTHTHTSRMMTLTGSLDFCCYFITDGQWCATLYILFIIASFRTDSQDLPSCSQGHAQNWT